MIKVQPTFYRFWGVLLLFWSLVHGTIADKNIGLMEVEKNNKKTPQFCHLADNFCTHMVRKWNLLRK